MTATTRTRKSKLPGKPAPGTQVMICAKPGCGREYPPADERPAVEHVPGGGDYRAVQRDAKAEGWQYRVDQGWLCTADRDWLPWAPRTRPALLPARVPGATTRTAEVTGVVPSTVSWSTAALPAAEPPLEPLPETEVMPLDAAEQRRSSPAADHLPDTRSDGRRALVDVPRSRAQAAGKPGSEHTTAHGPGHPDHGPAFVALEQWVADQDSEATGG